MGCNLSQVRTRGHKGARNKYLYFFFWFLVDNLSEREWIALTLYHKLLYTHRNCRFWLELFRNKDQKVTTLFLVKSLSCVKSYLPQLFRVCLLWLYQAALCEAFYYRNIYNVVRHPYSVAMNMYCFVGGAEKHGEKGTC